MAVKPLAELVGPGWSDPRAPVEDRLRSVGEFLRGEQEAGRAFLPSGDRVLAAFERPFDQARVLIVGQDSVPRIESAHPSPMSADRGFFGSRPFTRANEALEEQGAEPVDRRLP